VAWMYCLIEGGGGSRRRARGRRRSKKDAGGQKKMPKLITAYMVGVLLRVWWGRGVSKGSEGLATAYRVGRVAP
jgi:hypothetical protein